MLPLPPLPPAPRDNSTALQTAFLALLPTLHRQAAFAFRGVICPVQRMDQIAETVALAWKWYVRLAQRGKDVTRFPTAFCALAARAVRCGRRLCGQEKARDVLSPSAQRRHGFRVEALPASTATTHASRYAVIGGQRRQDLFEERLHDNTKTPVPDQVAFRLDFPVWLACFGPRQQRLIRALANNERPRDLSRQLKVTSARISQLRRQFRESWQRFGGQATPAEAARPPSHLDRISGQTS